MTLDERTERMKELCEKATPGPWDHIVKMAGFTAVGSRALIARVFSIVFKDLEEEKSNAEFIAEARTYIPLVIAERAELQSKVRMLEAVLRSKTRIDAAMQKEPKP